MIKVLKKCYYCRKESHFQLIELDTLRYLVNTSNSEVIKVYAYLLNKSQNFVNYSFTGKELAIAIGYDYKQKNTKNKIKDIILFLENNGLLVNQTTMKKSGKWKSSSSRMRIRSEQKSRCIEVKFYTHGEDKFYTLGG